jgi:hypothetical protein
MASRGRNAAQSKYDHLIKLLLIGDSGEYGAPEDHGDES